MYLIRLQTANQVRLRAHGGRRHKDPKTGQLAGAGSSNQTYNRYKSYLFTIFKFGIRCGYNTINPVELIEAAPVVGGHYEQINPLS